jgi:Eukaryotic porin
MAPLFSVQLLAANKLSLFSASYFHKVNNSVEAGAKAVWNKGTDTGVAVEVGTKVLLDSASFVKAKVTASNPGN